MRKGLWVPVTAATLVATILACDGEEASPAAKAAEEFSGRPTAVAVVSPPSQSSTLTLDAIATAPVSSVAPAPSGALDPPWIISPNLTFWGIFPNGYGDLPTDSEIYIQHLTPDIQVAADSPVNTDAFYSIRVLVQTETEAKIFTAFGPNYIVSEYVEYTKSGLDEMVKWRFVNTVPTEGGPGYVIIRVYDVSGVVELGSSGRIWPGEQYFNQDAIEYQEIADRERPAGFLQFSGPDIPLSAVAFFDDLLRKVAAYKAQNGLTKTTINIATHDRPIPLN